ncbi:transposase [Cohnella rhizosphaerae]|uniref:Transposase n=1 Tax=Cohnella rhizosphaerae TaxID=1457232 RepID=A0A9X4QW88_9BACL|nr:transposase [Cohnella rhizosphaerae]MDG0814196.1 transposase [Cohnella rhizosphaerae]
MPSRFSIRDAMPAFSTTDCEHALFAAKWPDGFRCPRCGHPHYYEVSSRARTLFECRSCTHQASLTAGTVLEGSRTPLTKWFQAMFLMQLGISARLLSELIEVTYKTAWLINHKLRHAIGVRDRERPLEGDLQLLDEYYGYEYHRYLGSVLMQQALKPQPVVVGAALDAAGDFVHLKMKAVDGPDGDDAAMRGGAGGEEAVALFVEKHVAGQAAGDRAERLERGHQGRSALHIAWREAVRWLNWTFGGIGPKHLQAYLNEFCFRRLLVRTDMLAELIACCGATKTITYRRLVGLSSRIRPIPWAYRRPERGGRCAV